MTQKIEEWMRDAAKQSFDAVYSDSEVWIDVAKMAAIIASHAPSQQPSSWDGLNFELAERDRIIKGLVADNERLGRER